ncbi:MULTISPECIES: 1-deoxy-D-xylulose-5-phosphate reductoisomerase [Sutcliffiella]|uniref:1-deoxy-D-xylulose 5-phosphate reductoisomerase n=1 Tax=Sutcliffiella cohnii TaxID=33932 RepID=A0A223KRG6_9BACI|nr:MULTISPECIES: 1-deoxy-D-xylulose-5-phosphate reductoisomerase [Sutcliffiella]AST92026.1 1-deoxy-D-xylulose-5-phosphate reductoisomerase [Sutcliffiella cohnii]MED4015307.1 1-deoxy-D-xylulose-5-phosphate reductoisomerase [Sutcliffiella cohnii]WBL13261.1 1-deoxy-D-xylulose-5-phosphate reductoisomerase [Sutcliffiella sp. NC1]
MKRISLLGASGSIGTQTLDVIRQHPEHFELIAFSVGTNVQMAIEIIKEFSPKLVSVNDMDAWKELKTKTSSSQHVEILYGEEGNLAVATIQEADILVNAVVGSVGLIPTLQAIECKKTIALANKETLVTAGHLVMEAAKKNDVDILPVDSEHSAIFQCLQGEREKNIHSLIITASGGSFRDKTREQLVGVTVDEALQHPNWSMGAKITIDSATMMNKGLEVIEAHWLFNIPYDRINVLLHRESIIHSMVEFHDTSIIAQLGTPDMRVPIRYALTYPDRLPYEAGNRLSLADIGRLHFEQANFERYRCLQFAFEAGKIGGTLPTVLNAANEIAVSAFLNKQIDFLTIESFIAQAMNRHQVLQNPDLPTIQDVDKETREFVRSLFE